jgi:hypothetical protein
MKGGMHNEGVEIAQSRPRSLRHVNPDTSRHPGKHRRRDAHRLGRYEDSLVPERTDARNFLSATAHLLRERVHNVRVCARLDTDRFCLCLRLDLRRVSVSLCLEACAFRDGFRRRDGSVRLCVGLRLARYVNP